MNVKDVKIPLGNNEINLKIISFLDKAKLLDKKEIFLEEVCKDIETLDEENHFGGSIGKEEFKLNLRNSLFRNSQRENYPSEKIDFDKIINNIKSSIEKVKNVLGKRDLLIYIFPTNDELIIKDLGGVWGLVAWEDILHIFVNPSENWELNLQSTIIHELAHCIQDYYTYEMTLFDHLVADGLAEHFQEDILKGKRNNFTQAVSKEEAKNILKELNNKLGEKMNKNPEIHTDLFFGSDKYISGTGYTIGYYLVGDFIKDNEKDWRKLLRQEPSEFKLSPFFN